MCYWCEYFDYDGRCPEVTGEGVIGPCKRYPPQMDPNYELGDRAYNSDFPYVLFCHWCGEYKRREKRKFVRDPDWEKNVIVGEPFPKADSEVFDVWHENAG